MPFPHRLFQVRHALLAAAFITIAARANEAAIQVQIPAQPLGQALNSLALQTGTRIIFSTELTDGKDSTAVSGVLSAQEALNRLLVGSGLAASVEGSEIHIRKASGAASVSSQDSDQAATTLSSITVSGNYIPTTAEEAASNYTVSRSSNATKLDLSIKETPQSLSVITEKQMQDQNLTSISEVLKVTPGITVQEYGVPGAGRIHYYSRGYPIENFQIDGMPTSASMFGGSDLMGSMDSAIYERVEVIRGSTGLTAGTGEPSGSVNFVRKRPGYEPAARMSVSHGTWNKTRAEVDAQTPFNESGTLRGRAVAVYGRGQHWMDRVKDETNLFYGIVEADLSDMTMVWGGFNKFDKWVDDASPHGTDLQNNSGGIYDLAEAQGRAFNAATQWSWSKQDVKQYFAGIRHHFNDDWQLNTSYQYTQANPDRVYGIVGMDWYDAANKISSFNQGRIRSKNETHNLDITLNGKFQMFGREAQIATGFNGFKGNILSPFFDSLFNDGAAVNLENWNDGNIPFPKYKGSDYFIMDGFGGYTDNREKQYGAFFSTKFSPLEDVIVIAGIRYHKYDAKTLGYSVKDCEYREHIINWGCSQADDPTSVYHLDYPKKTIPYAGLIYALTPRTSVYTSYTGIHKIQQEFLGISPIVVEAEYGGYTPILPVAPKEGNTIELGVKSALNDDRLNLHAAVFRMKEKNVAVPLNAVESSVVYTDKDGFERRIYMDCKNPYSTTNQCFPAKNSDGPTVMGFEVSIAGQISDRWMINAGYTHLNIDLPEKLLEYTYGQNFGYNFSRPKHTFNLFTTYDITDSLTVGGGMRWRGTTSQTNDNGTDNGSVNVYTQGAYAVYDFMAHYKISKNLTTSLNVGNVFDKTYFSNDRASYYGAPRNVTASLSLKF